MGGAWHRCTRSQRAFVQPVSIEPGVFGRPGGAQPSAVRPAVHTPTHRWCPSRQPSPSHERAEDSVTTEPCSSTGLAPALGWLPWRNAAATPSCSDHRSRGLTQGAATHDRQPQVHLRQACPRRQTPRQEVRRMGRRDFRPRPVRRNERAPLVFPPPHRARAHPLRHHRQRRRHDAARGARRGPQTHRLLRRARTEGHRAPGTVGRASPIAPLGREGWTIRDHRAILRSEPYARADLGAASDLPAKSLLSEAAPVSSPSPI